LDASFPFPHKDPTSLVLG